MSEQLSLDDDFDPDDRVLCPDAACIGILDASGRCKECGAQASAELSSKRPAGDASLAPSESADGVVAADAADAVSPPTSSADSPAADAEGDDFADRQLCSDPLCIGVLDPAGRCKECGRSSSPAAS